MNDPRYSPARSRPTIAGRSAGVGAIGAVGAAAAMICCAMPLVLSSGAVAAAVGVGTGAWLLTAMGVGLVIVALARRQRRACTVRPCATGGLDLQFSTIGAHDAFEEAPGSLK